MPEIREGQRDTLQIHTAAAVGEARPFFAPGNGSGAILKRQIIDFCRSDGRKQDEKKRESKRDIG